MKNYLRAFVLMPLAACTPSSAGDEDRVNAFLLEGSVVEVGSIPVNSSVWFSLTLQNPLKEPLTVFDVNASCGCLVTDFRPRELPPGETYEVEITLRARSAPGVINERIRVFSTSSELNGSVIYVHGEAKAGPTIGGDFEFGTIRPEFGAEATLSIHGVEGWLAPDQEFEIITESALPGLSFSQVRESSDQLTIIATLDPCSIRGFFETRVRLYFPSYAFGGLKAYIAGRVTGAGVPTIWADPPTIYSHDLLSDATLKLDWMDSAKVTFPIMSRDGDDYHWVISEQSGEAPGCRVHFSVSDTQSLAEEGGLRIPFRADGREFELLVPYHVTK